MSGWKAAGYRLRPYRRQAWIPAAAELMLLSAALVTGACVQQQLAGAGVLAPDRLAGGGSLWELFLPLCLLTSAAALTPLHVQRAWICGEISGVLDADDLGFLQASSSLWLWGRYLAVRLAWVSLTGLSFLPGFAALTLARAVMQTAAAEPDAFPALLTAAHLLLSAAGSLLLPMRLLAAGTALPFCFLKTPHLRVRDILSDAFKCSRKHWFFLSGRRILLFPLLMLPPFSLHLSPRLLTAEMIEASRRQNPPKTVVQPVQKRRRALRALLCIPIKLHGIACKQNKSRV